MGATAESNDRGCLRDNGATIWFSGAFGLRLLVATLAFAANKPCFAAKMEDLSTVWIGKTLGEYFRLELGPDGHGATHRSVCVVGKPARHYKVTRTDLSDRGWDTTAP
jgi:hypothetical protein